MNNKLVVVVMGQNCEKFLPMCLESVQDADFTIYCDGGSTDKSIEIFNNNTPLARGDVIENKYNQDDPTMNGKQRNFYLTFLKEHFPNDWAICLDADEVVEDLSKIKELINRSADAIYSVKMRHFHNDLGHEDATVETHWVQNRLFKISEAVSYPEVEHPILQGKPTSQYSGTDITTIWHLAHINHCFNIKGRYEKNILHSNIHNKQFLDWWLRAHIFGQYPNKQIDLRDIPEVILKNFHIDKDEFYFANRNVEVKHPIMVKQWADYFKPESVLDLGCGRGCYLYFWNWYVKDCAGLEISHWAVNNAFTKVVGWGDITDIYTTGHDLVTAIDVLEHLDDEGLSKALDSMSIAGKRFLFSIPYKGNPDLDNDKTHKQFKTKDEWKALIKSHGIETEDAPADWLFAPQLLIGKLDKKI